MNYKKKIEAMVDSMTEKQAEFFYTLMVGVMNEGREDESGGDE